MSQQIPNNINPAATSGTQLATLLNLFKDALASGFSGTSRPANLQAGGSWIDTTNNPTSWSYKLYTGSTDILIATFNLTTGAVSFGSADGQFSLLKASDDAVGPFLNFIKKRVAALGQTLTDDVLGQFNFNSTDDDGDLQVSARVRVVNIDDTTDAAFGAYVAIDLVDAGGASLTEKFRFHNGRLGIGTGVLPSFELHTKGLLGVGAETVSDTAGAGAKITGRRSRATGTGGQLLASDVIAQFKGNSTDNTGAEIDSAFVIEGLATATHTTTDHSTQVDFKAKVLTTLTTMFSLTALGASARSLIFGTSGTAASNVKVMRSAAGKVSVVLGNDVTAEGSEPTTLAQLAHIVERFSTAGKPANAVANTGRIIYITDTNKFEYDTGSAWAGLGGGALVTSTQAAVVAGTGITISGTDSRRLIKVTGNASGENDLSAATLQIAAGVNDGDELILSGQSLDNYIVLRKLDTFKGVKLTADWTSFDGKICLVWSSTTSLWEELYRVTY